MRHGFRSRKSTTRTPSPAPRRQPKRNRARSPRVASLIALLSQSMLRLTSTLTVFEASVPGRPILFHAQLDATQSDSRENDLKTWARGNGPNDGAVGAVWKRWARRSKKSSMTPVGAPARTMAPIRPARATSAGHRQPGASLELLVDGLRSVQAITKSRAINGARGCLEFEKGRRQHRSRQSRGTWW